jgi:hypothetical protein
MAVNMRAGLPAISSRYSGRLKVNRMHRRAYTLITWMFSVLALFLTMVLSTNPASNAGAPTSPSPSPPAPAMVPAPKASEGAPQPSPISSPADQALPAPSPAPRTNEELSQFEIILEKMKMVNRGLRDYSSTVRITGMARYSLLDIPLFAEGIYYFKEPDKNKLKLSRGPHYLAQYPQALGWNLPSPDEWTGKVRESQENGKDYIILKLIPINGIGDLLKIEMWVDRSTYLFSKQIYYYRNNGKLILDSSYRVVDGFSLFNKLTGHIEFPGKNIKGDAEAEYGDYRINQGIDDSLFQEDKKKK